MKFNMERRQKYLEEILRRQQRQIFKISKELELHREFLNLQFESFMDFLFQHGGQIIQLSGKSGQDETGMFFPMKKKNGGAAGGNVNGEEAEGNDANNGNGVKEETNGEDKDNGMDEEDDLDPLPPPQAILGSPSADGDENSDVSYQRQNGSHEGEQSSSRRSSQNVVSSSDAQNGDGDYDDADSSGEFESNQNPEMMKYDMNHFMFSHFLDGGGNEEDQDGMDDSYNDDDMAGYDGEDDMADTSRSMGNRRQSSWTNNGNARSSTSASAPHMSQMSGKLGGAGTAPGGNNTLPVPPANFPHNERTCRYCGKTFHWKQSWVIHERTHTGEKPYVCKCGKAFSQKSNMNTHAKSCSQATATQKGQTTVYQMKCSHCQKMFTHKKNLDLHMEKFHPEVLNLSTKAPSSSSSPSSSYYQNGSTLLDSELAVAAAAQAAENAAILQILKTAQAQSTSNSNSTNKTPHGSVSPPITHNSNSNSSMSGSDDRNNRFPCPYCPKRFPVKGTLERHLRVHTGEKPFLCGLCGKAFTQKGSVKLHLERVHRQSM